MRFNRPKKNNNNLLWNLPSHGFSFKFIQSQLVFFFLFFILFCFPYNVRCCCSLLFVKNSIANIYWIYTTEICVCNKRYRSQMHFTLAYKIVHEPKFNWDETNLEFYFIRSNVKHSQIGYNVFNSIFCKPNDYYAHKKKNGEKL